MRSVKCPVCKGAGLVLCPICSSSTKTDYYKFWQSQALGVCTLCRGTRTVTCIYCKGKGVVTICNYKPYCEEFVGENSNCLVR